MLKAGVFQKAGEIFQVFEVDEKGFYRIDITREGARFNIDIDKVIYSQIVRRKTSVFGDQSLFDEYQNILTKVNSLQKNITKNSHWEDGVFITESIADIPKFNCTVKNITHDGKEYETEIKYNNYFISMVVVDPIYGVKIEPLNFDQYREVSLSTDTIDTSSIAPYYTLDILRRRYDIAHIEDNDFVVADTMDLAKQRLSEWLSSDSIYLGFDTETTGTDVDLYGEDKMVGIILGESETKSTYFPFRHTSNLQNLPIEFLKDIVNAMNSRLDRLVAHNKKFDRKVMLKEGYDIRVKWDTMQIALVLDPIIAKNTHDLKHLLLKLNGKKYLELDEIFQNRRDIDFSVLPKDIVRVYGCPDGSNVITLIKDQMTKLPQNQMRLVDMECKLADLCADMEYYGIRVNVEKYEEQYKNCNYIIEILLKAFRTLTKEDGNINSAEVLKNLIYNKMNCPVVKRTKKGEPSTSLAVIKMLASKKAKEPNKITQDLVDLNGNVIISAKALSNSAYPAMLILSTYKKYIKLQTAFYARFERTMKTGRVFFWINQNGTATGRQSSPMHQLPDDLKKCILSDSDSKDFWGPDYSQIELRMIAYLAGEKELIDMACNPDNDIHRVIGALISNCEMWEITKEMRTTGKRRNFGVVYEISAMGLAGQIFGPGFTQEDVVFCQKQLDDFYRRFKRISRFLKFNAEFVQQHGYMETKWFHRKRLFPDIFDPDLEPRKRASILRMSNNMPVQGTSADYLKLAEVQMYDWIRASGWNEIGDDGFPRVRIMLSIHDELIISSDRSIPYEEIITMITKCMQTPVPGAPPFFVQPALMDDWHGHSDDACAMPIPLRDKLIEDYARTGVSVINHDNYLKVLADFRSKQLEDYMTNLITKYGPDPYNVGAHVRDGVLTFALLDLYEKAIKKNNPDINQVDLINEATKLYMENEGKAVKITQESKPVATVADNDKFEAELEEIINYDQDGNIIYEEADAQEEPDYMDATDDEMDVVKRITDDTPTYVWEVGDAIVVNTESISSTDSINSILQRLAKDAVDDGFYTAYIIYNDKLLNTKLHIEHCDLDELNKYVIDLSDKR